MVSFTLSLFLVLVTFHQGCGGSEEFANIVPTDEIIVEPPPPLPPHSRNSIKAKGTYVSTNSNFKIDFEIILGLDRPLKDTTHSGVTLTKVFSQIQFIWKFESDFCGIPKGTQTVTHSVEVAIGNDNSRIYIPQFNLSSGSYTFSSSDEFTIAERADYADEGFPFSILSSMIQFDASDKMPCHRTFN